MGKPLSTPTRGIQATLNEISNGGSAPTPGMRQRVRPGRPHDPENDPEHDEDMEWTPGMRSLILGFLAGFTLAVITILVERQAAEAPLPIPAMADREIASPRTPAPQGTQNP